MNAARLPALLLFVILAVALCVSASAQARYLFPQLTDVPLKRLIANLEAQVRSAPDDRSLLLNLARAHAMAYARDSDDAKVGVEMRDGRQMNLWSPPAYSLMMPQTVAISPATAARTHLAKAIKLYQDIVHGRLDGNQADADYVMPVARLGYAWCLEQSGAKEAAIAEYRLLVHTGSASAPGTAGASRQPRTGIDWSNAAAEAAGYLIALLDPQLDAAEIATLRERKKRFLSRLPITPIAIPLSPRTQLSEIEDGAARVAFDADASGSGRHWSWITPRAGWLVYDPRQTGNIDSGIRLFGNVTFWMFWQNGYQALATLDDDRDGTLDRAELAGLAVWIDRNRNGSCEAGEVASLAELDIAALHYAHVALPGHADHIVYAPQGVQFKDGSRAASYDIVLHPRP